MFWTHMSRHATSSRNRHENDLVKHGVCAHGFPCRDVFALLTGIIAEAATGESLIRVSWGSDDNPYDRRYGISGGSSIAEGTREDWDCVLHNQNDDVVATYDVLTAVAKS